MDQTPSEFVLSDTGEDSTPLSAQEIELIKRSEEQLSFGDRTTATRLAFPTSEYIRFNDNRGGQS